MASDVGIVNEALRLIGETTIIALTDDNKAARIASDTYEEHRDYVTDLHPWTFAMKRVSLAADVATPDWEFASQYSLPSDCLSPYRVNGEDEYSGKWRVEGRKIVSDLSAPLQLLYIARITDADAMTPRFREVLAAYLAYKWCIAFTDGRDRQEQLKKDYEEILAVARSRDSQEGTREPMQSDTWITARLGPGDLRRDIRLNYDPGTIP